MRKQARHRFFFARLLVVGILIALVGLISPVYAQSANRANGIGYVSETTSGVFTTLAYRLARGFYLNLFNASPTDPTAPLQSRNLWQATANTLPLATIPGLNLTITSTTLAVSLAELIIYTPSGLTFEDPNIVTLTQVIRVASFALLIIIIAVRYLEMAGRIAFSPGTKVGGNVGELGQLATEHVMYFTAFVGAWFSPVLVALLIWLGNVIIMQILGGGLQPPPIYQVFDPRQIEAAIPGGAGSMPSADVLYPEFVFGLCLYVASLYFLALIMFARIILIDVLVALAPLAILFLCFSATRRYGVFWLAIFLGTIAAQIVVVGYLQIGGSIIMAFRQATFAPLTVGLWLGALIVFGAARLFPLVLQTVSHHLQGSGETVEGAG